MHTFENVFSSQSFKSALPSIQHPLSPLLPCICPDVCPCVSFLQRDLDHLFSFTEFTMSITMQLFL